MAACGNGQWQCKNGQCVNATARCDQRYDCMDKSDEYSCEGMGYSHRHMSMCQCTREFLSAEIIQIFSFPTPTHTHTHRFFSTKIYIIATNVNAVNTAYKALVKIMFGQLFQLFICCPSHILQVLLVLISYRLCRRARTHKGPVTS